ncbi:MAG: STAS domain-containing protein [Gemmatimonadetes bacterium]|nr:STAS domain-containing protein [Gemmatimonadota bacterium]
MGIESRTDGGTLHFRVEGALDGPTAGALRRDMVDGALDAERIVVDLAAVPWVNSAGLGHLAAAYSTLREKGQALRLVSANPRVRALLDAARLSALLGEA